MLWALGALQIFDDRMAESLEKIREARGGEIQRYLNQVSVGLIPGFRSRISHL
jgi:hypothetical protein